MVDTLSITAVISLVRSALRVFSLAFGMSILMTAISPCFSSFTDCDADAEVDSGCATAEYRSGRHAELLSTQNINIHRSFFFFIYF